MDKTNNERQMRLKAKRRAAGLTEFTEWVLPQDVPAAREAIRPFKDRAMAELEKLGQYDRSKVQRS